MFRSRLLAKLLAAHTQLDDHALRRGCCGCALLARLVAPFVDWAEFWLWYGRWCGCWDLPASADPLSIQIFKPILLFWLPCSLGKRHLHDQRSRQNNCFFHAYSLSKYTVASGLVESLATSKSFLISATVIPPLALITITWGASLLTPARMMRP